MILFLQKFLLPAIFFFSIFFFSSCLFKPLDIQTQYIDHKELASYHVGTPDPLLALPFLGQRLLIQWNLPSFSGNEILFLKVRFCNHHEKEISLHLLQPHGTYLYEIRGETYVKTGGILSYYVEVKREEKILEKWTHPLWVPFLSHLVEKEREFEKRSSIFMNRKQKKGENDE